MYVRRTFARFNSEGQAIKDGRMGSRRVGKVDVIKDDFAFRMSQDLAGYRDNQITLSTKVRVSRTYHRDQSHSPSRAEQTSVRLHQHPS